MDNQERDVFYWKQDKNLGVSVLESSIHESNKKIDRLEYSIQIEKETLAESEENLEKEMKRRQALRDARLKLITALEG